jgi:hypothetical protein
MNHLKRLIRTTLFEVGMSDHWLESSVVSEMKSMGFEGDGKVVDNNGITHFVFIKELPEKEGVFSAVITKGTHDLMVLLRAYSVAEGTKKNLFHKTIKTPSELSKLKGIMEEYMEKINLIKLGISQEKIDKPSRSDIEKMIDTALDKRDFKEAERLTKML